MAAKGAPEKGLEARVKELEERLDLEVAHAAAMVDAVANAIERAVGVDVRSTIPKRPGDVVPPGGPQVIGAERAG